MRLTTSSDGASVRCPSKGGQLDAKCEGPSLAVGHEECSGPLVHPGLIDDTTTGRLVSEQKAVPDNLLLQRFPAHLETAEHGATAVHHCLTLKKTLR